MSRRSGHEYAAVVRLRYRASGKRQRGRLLDEFCAVTGYHRKAAIRLLGAGERQARQRERRGRPATYRLAEVAALQRVWEASDRRCGKCLAPFLPDLLEALERHGELHLEEAVRAQLLGISAATIDRVLQPARREGRRRPLAQTGALATLKAQIPIRTFGEWAGVTPGACQGDLVLHCGESTEGFSLTTLVVVDVATSWTELEPVWGKGQQRVGGALHHARERLPFALRELHTDNGGEFLNQVVTPYCRRCGIQVTRGRPYRKNDQAYVEQKNWTAVRQRVGYDRYASKAAFAQLGVLYRPLRWYLNFFQPVRKLIGKARIGAKVTKRYDPARTPYQRLLAAEVLDERERERLGQLYLRLNPVQLRAEIDAALAHLWTLAQPADRASPARAAASG